LQVTPDKTVIYIITAQNAFGQATDNVTITVAAEPPPETTTTTTVPASATTTVLSGGGGHFYSCRESQPSAWPAGWTSSTEL